MMITLLNPERVFGTLEQDLTRAFSRRQAYPPVNVYASEEDVTLTSEIPGILPDDLDISIAGDTLTLKAERKPIELEASQTWHRRERGFGSFTRTIKLPYNIESSKVEASFDRGVLRLSLPRAESDKPRKINVRTA